MLSDSNQIMVVEFHAGTYREAPTQANKNPAFFFDCFAVFFENQNQSMILEPRFSKIQIDLTYALLQIPLLNNSIQTTNYGFIS